jgi:hypothetical protein
MARNKKQFSAFSLSFLDIMSCGLGAFILLFLIAKNHGQQETLPKGDYLGFEIEKLEKQLAQASSDINILKEKEISYTSKIQGEKQQQTAAIEKLNLLLTSMKRLAQPPANRAALEKAIDSLKKKKEQLKQQLNEKSIGVRAYAGDGNREYLTGMRLGGDNILILLDASCSMLDESIVNIIRRRNMSDEVKRRSPKWLQALATIDWISARFPQSAKYQIYTFDDTVRSIIPNSEGKWLEVNNANELDQSITALKKIIPDGGSNLESALMVISELSPAPDNVYLITDGLPTRGLRNPTKNTVTGVERQKHFELAVTRIPPNIPMNVILLPTEGDPMAPAAFWQVARVTSGSFLSPATDWP